MFGCKGKGLNRDLNISYTDETKEVVVMQYQRVESHKIR